jgi:hypothetical protein
MKASLNMREYLFVSSCDGHMYDTRKLNWSKNTPLRANYAIFGRHINDTIALRAAIRNPYAWPGGYEIFFLTSDGALLCHDCVCKEYRNISDSIRHNRQDGWNVVGITLDNEMEEMEYCAHCNKVINPE